MNIAESHKKYLGCSMLAQALGVSKNGTPYQLWERYVGRAPWPDISNELRVAIGEPMEEVLKPFAEKRLNRTLIRDRQEFVHPDARMVGHVDFRCAQDAEHSDSPPVDMKTSLGWGSRFRFTDEEDGVDADVFMQMQGYTLLLGESAAHIVAFVTGPELKTYAIKAEPEIHGFILEGVERFWWHVDHDIAPKPITLEDAKRRWPRDLQPGIYADAEALEHDRELRKLKAQIKQLEAEADAHELALKEAMGDYESLLGPNGKPIRTWKTKTSMRIDVDAIKAAGIYEQYLKTNTSRVFIAAGK